MWSGVRAAALSTCLLACGTESELRGSQGVAPSALEPAVESGDGTATLPSAATSGSPVPQLAVSGFVAAPRVLTERLEISDSAEHFAVRGAEHVDVFDTDGRHAGRIPSTARERRHRFWGSRLLVPKLIGSDSHIRRVSAFDVYSVTGERLTEIPAPGARFTRPAGDFLMTVQPHVITRWDDRGQRVWSFSGSAHELASALQTDAQVWVDERDTRRLIHLRQGEEHTTFSCRSPIWNVAIDPLGRYSAATTQWRLHRFEHGRWLGSVDVPAPYLTSVAVSVAGDVLVGTTDFDQLGQVLWFDAEGQLRTVWQFGSDANSLRPKVRFVEDGSKGAFSVEHGQALYRGALGQPTLDVFTLSSGLQRSLQSALRGER